MKVNKLLMFLFLMPLFAMAQKQITGEVITNPNGVPLPGASIVIEGQNEGTTTDFDGKFVLNNVSEDAVLVVSYVGYLTQKISVKGQDKLIITLKEDAQSLEEVVVTGYSTERKVDVTGAISVVEIGPVQGQAMSSGNAMQALQGRVPGLYVEKSGDPSGLNSQILIRGISTLGNNEPLYVIDGVPTKRQEVFASLNASSIASVQVLKDASASSLYGARASNGVIVVTTKNRRSGENKVNVSLNTNYSVQSEKKQRYDMMNAVQRGQAIWQASVNDGSNPTDGYGALYNFDWNNDFSNPILNSVTVQPYVGGNTSVPAGDTDWQDASYQTGYVYNTDLSVDATTDKSSLFFNLGYLKNTGILKFTNYDRINAKFNGSVDLLNDKVTVGVNTLISTSNSRGAAKDVGGAPTPALAVSYVPTIPLFDSNGNYGGPLGAGYSDRNNPLLMQDLNKWDNKELTNVFGNVYAELKLMDNLKFRTSLGVDYYDFKNKDIEPRVANGFVNRSNNRLTLTSSEFTSMVFTNLLTYDLELGKSKFNFLLGHESIKDDYDNFVAQANEFAVETESYFVVNAATGARTATGNSTGSSLESEFFKGSYSYDNKYLATFTVRRDGSSRFGENNRYGIFPAATLGWKLSEEDFIQDVDAINNLKLRVGYGEVGNQEIGDTARFGLYETRYGPNLAVYNGGFWEIYNNIGTAYDLNGADTGTLPSGFVSIQAPNPDLKWETTKEINAGVDFALFNDFVGSFDYFKRNTSDILTTPPIASAIGEGQLRVLNGADVEVSGWEFALAYSKQLKNGLNITVAGTMGASADKVTYLPEEVVSYYPGTVQNSIIGHSTRSIFGYTYDGLFQTQAEVDASGQTAARLGGIKYKDINGDGVINADDRDFLGDTLAGLEYGLRVDLNYKNFDFSVFGSGVADRIGVDAFVYWNNFVQGRENGGLGLLNAWTPSNTNTDIPALSLVNNQFDTSDYFYRNNSYFKIRNLQLGYNLSDEAVNSLGMSGMRVYLQGENLLWFTPKNYVGNDPERISIDNIPIPTTISLGLNINF